MAKKIFLAGLITLAILAMIPMAYREYRRWRLEKERAELIKTDHAHIDFPLMDADIFSSGANN